MPQWPLTDIYKGMMQFMGLQILGLIIVIIFPSIALWLPRGASRTLTDHQLSVSAAPLPL